MRTVAVVLLALVPLAACGSSSPAVTEPVPSSVGADPAEAAAAPAGGATDPLAPPADVAAAPADAKKTASGLAYKVLTPGTGTAHPTRDDEVKVHYTGWTTDGKRFDSSVERGEPASFPLGRVIPGWTEGVQLMVVGEKTRFWIPAELAYGESPQGGAPAGTLVFDVELLEIL
jgi:peptidylprolyl isomerase